MPKFIQRETMACYVTFVQTVEAEDETEAEAKFDNGEGTLVEEIIGDAVGFLDHTTVEITQAED